MAELQKLIDGYKSFYQKYFVGENDVYQKLAREGQSPQVAMIACSDSRVDPSIITCTEPGDLFVIRNVANLVPPYQPDDATYHGTSAALEFAVNNLKVRHMVVFGHSKCAGIRALIESDPESGESSFVNSWMRIADDVRKKIKKECGHLHIDEQAHICEQRAVEKSMQNLRSFPWINKKIENKQLRIHGWYFDIDEGALYNFDEASGEWKKVG